MSGRQAKVLSDQQIEDLLVYTSATRNPERNRAIVLLSVKAGLRADEIAKLTWDMVLDPTGEVGSVIELRDRVAKKNSGRLIPLHSELRTALSTWRSLSEGVGAVIRSERGAGAFRAVGLEGCSSHSGRRTFITRAARVVHQAGASLRDVQLLAGHRSIQMTNGTLTATQTPSASSFR
jgi:integrase